MESFWDIKNRIIFDYVIVGAGFTGIHAANKLSEKQPKATIALVESNLHGAAASTKNAGFGCFGTVGEILADLETNSREDLIRIIRSRYKGMQSILNLSERENINLVKSGGYEVFFTNNLEWQHHCLNKIEEINELVEEAIGESNVFKEVNIKPFLTGFLDEGIFNALEFQIDPAKYRSALLNTSRQANHHHYSGLQVSDYVPINDLFTISFENHDQKIRAHNLLICTNGFANHLLPTSEVKPARGQIMLTSELSKNSIKGNFHVHKGYYYFRDVGHRVLLGGGRHINYEAETTSILENTAQFKSHLCEVLTKEVIPQSTFQIDHEWAGIMGMPDNKTPEIKQIEKGVFCAVGLGGMGVAISEQVADNLVNLVLGKDY